VVIALGRGTLGSNAVRMLGLKKTTKKAMPKPANKGGSTNFRSFSTVFLLLVSNPFMMAQKKITAASAAVTFIVLLLN
jgi:hypothetical protein